MAKQTFTTGQVLTAAQMTSLQQTAMGGGSTTDKTTSYVLVAADAGTTVIMNSASATTITVNTALFAAGDTVNIQNIGAGICTVTAGTATVNTAGSLALNQYEGGVLYFRSTSASTFFDYVQTGSVSPLTTKGDLYGYSTLDARIPIGTNNQVLTADSAQALGLKWATAAAGGGMTLISTTALSGASTAVTTIPSTYKNLIVHVVDHTQVTTQGDFSMAVNGAATSNNYFNYNTAAGSFNNGQNTTAKLNGGQLVYTGGTENNWNIYIDNYASSTSYKSWMSNGAYYSINSRYDTSQTFGNYLASTAISSLTFATSAGTFTGSVLLYGVN